jgi:hypothetical protein
MTAVQILSLLLALSTALNIAFATGVTAYGGGVRAPQAVLAGVATAGTVLTIYFTAVQAYK